MNDIYTEDFAEIMQCSRERHLALNIMKAWNEHGLPDRFDDFGIRLAFNRNSGNVFLVNEDGQVAMMNHDKLEIWHVLPCSGEEGFLEDFNTEADYHQSDAEYLQDWDLKLCGEVFPD